MPVVFAGKLGSLRSPNLRFWQQRELATENHSFSISTLKARTSIYLAYLAHVVGRELDEITAKDW